MSWRWAFADRFGVSGDEFWRLTWNDFMAGVEYLQGE